MKRKCIVASFLLLCFHIYAEDNKIGLIDTTIGTLINPIQTFSSLNENESNGEIGWIMTISYSILYSQTALILGLRDAVPTTPAIIPIPSEDYWLAQSGFTVPVSIASMGAGYGFIEAMGGLFGKKINHEALWTAYSSSMIVPTFITMYLPETLGAISSDPVLSWVPSEIHLTRIIIGSVWAACLSSIAVSQTTDFTILESIIIGTIAAGVTGTAMAIMFR